MEKWQKEYLTKHLHNLVEVTFCNEDLLLWLHSRKVLAKADLEIIRCKPDRYEKSGHLYDILKTRTNGYSAILRALQTCDQSGAYKILRQGVVQCWSPTIHVNFLGKTKLLSGYMSEAEIRQVVQSHMGYFESSLSEVETVTLVKCDPLPEYPLYISRQLCKRNIVNKKLFQVKTSDVFVFKGIQDLCKLRELVRPKIASRSSSQLEKLTSRFIHLEEEEDWANILNIAKVPVHLIKYEETTKLCVLERTTGGSGIVNQYLNRREDLQNPDTIVSEDVFIDSILNDSTLSGVCICDSPGMGKTLLLAKLAYKISERYPDRLVAFIPLSKFIKSATSNNDIHAEEVGTKIAEKCLSEYLSTSQLAQDILHRILTANTKIRLELLFDGFDEVPQKCVNFTRKLLTEFATNFRNTRIYVTSRPHMREQLEASLGVLSYDILPFSEANQLKFLVDFWKEELQRSDHAKLYTFGQYCLEKLKTGLTKTEQGITGVPLRCRLLAQVYSGYANTYATRSMLIDDVCKFEGSLPQLYKMYVEQGYEKLKELHDNAPLLEVKKYHMWKACKVLFPEMEPHFYQELSASRSETVVNFSVSMGILERRFSGNGETVEFVHRTFAEYFTSEFIANTLDSSPLTLNWTPDSKLEACKFTLENVLLTREISETDEAVEQIFINSVVVYFLNFFMEPSSSPLQPAPQLVSQFSLSVSPGHVRAIFLGCVSDNYTNLFKFIHAVLVSMDKVTLQNFADLGKPQFVLHLLNVASVFSNHFLMDELFTLFKHCFNLDLKFICNEIPVYLDTPLHFAVERGNDEMVQFFANFITMKGRNLLLSCVIRSNEDPPQIVKKKVDICKILLSTDPKLYTEASYTLYDSVHVELIKALISSGADPKATISKETVVHRGANYMSDCDFHELCRFLALERKLEVLFQRNESKWASPLLYILRQRKHLSVDTVKLILECGEVDVNERDDKGNNLFMIAVKEEQSNELLQLLMNFGADINAKNKYAQTALHLVPKTSDANSVSFLLNAGIDYCQRDILGNTFLHLLPHKELSAEKYHEVVRLLSSKDQTAIFHMQNDNKRLPIHHAVRHLEVCEETLQLFKVHKVNFNAIDKNGFTLYTCALTGQRSVGFLQILMEMGVDISSQEEGSKSFAHNISYYLSPEEYHQVLSLLIRNGHENAFMQADEHGTTPIHSALLYIELLPETLELIRVKLVESNKLSVNVTDNDGNSLLYIAALGKRNITILKAIMEMGVQVNLQNANGNTFAHVAPSYYSATEYHEIVRLLIERGHHAVFQMRNKYGKTPLHSAVHSMLLLQATLDLIRVELVETKKIDINAVDNGGCSILMSALLGDDPDGTISRYTALANVRWDKEEVNFVTYRSMEGATKTSTPQGKWSAGQLKSLVDMGADVFLQDKNGDTFAHFMTYFSSAEQFHEMVKMLVETGQEMALQVENAKGHTPLVVAFARMDLLEQTLDLINTALFTTGLVDINCTDKQGYSFLMSAALTARSVNFLKRLMEMGANVMTQKGDGRTFAHIASNFYSAKEYHDIVTYLLAKGHEKIFQIADDNGDTPLCLAFSLVDLLNVTLELINDFLFQTNIVDINCRDNQGSTFLINAATLKKNVGVLTKLMEMGADVMIQREDGCTVAHLVGAHYSGDEYYMLVKALIAQGHLKVFHVLNAYGHTPYHDAIGNRDILEATLDRVNGIIFQEDVIDINLTDRNGNSFLMSAAFAKRSVKFLTSLLDRGADVMIQNVDGLTFAHLIPYHYSPVEYHTIVELLVRTGRNQAFQLTNKEGETPLLVATAELELLENTLDLFKSTIFQPNFVSVNYATVSQRSFLMYAAFSRKSLRFLEKLINMGADVMTQDSRGNTFAHFLPLYYTPEQYHNIVCLLFNTSHEKVFQIQNDTGETPLHYALHNLELLPATLELIIGRLEEKKILDINCCTDKNGESFLMHAVTGKRSLDLISTLVIRFGMDVTHQNNNGRNIFHIAPLFYSAVEYHQILELVLKTGSRKLFKQKNDQGATPIHVAFLRLELPMKTLHLLNRKFFQTNIVNINSTDNEGNSLLHYATSGGRSTKFLAALIRFGADVTRQNIDGENFACGIAIGYSAKEYHDKLKMLVRKGLVNVFQVVGIDGASAIHKAVGKLELSFETLSLFNTSIFQTKIVDVNSIDAIGNSLLCYAARGKRSVAFLEHLINFGVDVLMQNKNGDTVVHLIPENCSPDEYHEIVKMLMGKGFDKIVKIVNDSGQTPLHLAVERLEIAEKTMKLIGQEMFKGCVADTNGNSLLMYSITGKRSVHFLTALIKMGVDVHVQNQDGNTFAHFLPHHLSAEEYHELVKLLVETEQENVLNIRNNYGSTPIHLAIVRMELLEATLALFHSSLFRKNIVDINSTDNEGSSFLHYAIAGKRSTNFLRVLLEMRPDVNAQTKEGNTIAHLIANFYTPEEYHNMLELLVEKGQENVFQVVNKNGANPIHLAVLRLELNENTLKFIQTRLFQSKIVNINSVDSQGNSLLLYAVEGKRSVGFLRLLVEMGVDVSIPKLNGCSFASKIVGYTPEEYHGLVVFLLERGHADVFDAANSDGVTPAQFAVYHLELLPETVELLFGDAISVQSGNNPKEGSGFSLQLFSTAILDESPGFQSHFSIFLKTTMRVVAFFNLLPVTTTCKKRGLRLNVVDKRGHSVLHWAIFGKRSLQFVKHLVSLGATTCSVKNNHNHNLAHLAASQSLIEHLKYFAVELGCNINDLDNDGDNVLQCAILDAKENVFEMVVFLLDQGADKFHINNKQHTAFDCAVEKGITDDRILTLLK